MFWKKSLLQQTSDSVRKGFVVAQTESPLVVTKQFENYFSALPNWQETQVCEKAQGIVFDDSCLAENQMVPSVYMNLGEPRAVKLVEF